MDQNFLNGKKKKISVFMCLKDSGNYVEYMKQIYTELEIFYNDCFIFEYFFYENNSHDNTKQNLINFKNIVKGDCNLILENTPPPPKFEPISLERGQFVRNMRNEFKKRVGKLNSDYIFYIDDDVYFKIDLIKELILKIKDNVKMVVSNGISLRSLLEENSVHHYDTLAFISLDNISHKQTGNTCLSINCERCKLSRRHKNKHMNLPFLNDKYLTNMDHDDIEIKSGFGSCSLIETNMWNKINFTNDEEEIQELEWPSLCKNIRDNGGKIILSCKSKTFIVDKKWDYIKDKDLIIDNLNKL